MLTMKTHKARFYVALENAGFFQFRKNYQLLAKILVLLLSQHHNSDYKEQHPKDTQQAYSHFANRVITAFSGLCNK